MNNRIKAIIRLVATLVLTVNMYLTAKGINPIPFDEAMITEAVTLISVIGSEFWTWFKDAPMTKIANKHHDEMVLEKKTLKGASGENFFDAVEEVGVNAE